MNVSTLFVFIGESFSSFHINTEAQVHCYEGLLQLSLVL